MPSSSDERRAKRLLRRAQVVKGGDTVLLLFNDNAVSAEQFDIMVNMLAELMPGVRFAAVDGCTGAIIKEGPEHG